MEISVHNDLPSAYLPMHCVIDYRAILQDLIEHACGLEKEIFQSYSITMATQERVRLMIFFYRKKGMSFEDFDLYWRESHPAVACALPIFKKNILKYEQVSQDNISTVSANVPDKMMRCQIHVDKESRENWKKDGHSVSDYDGIVVLEAASEDKIREVFQDPEYFEKLKPDEEKFCERTTFTMFPAKSFTVFDNPA